MKKVYPVILTKNEGVVLVEIPDLKILTQGKDLADAIYMARDAIGLKIISMEDDGEEVPGASDMAGIDIRGSEFYEEGNSFVTLVDIDVDYISSGALTHSSPILDLSLKNLHAV